MSEVNLKVCGGAAKETEAAGDGVDTGAVSVTPFEIVVEARGGDGRGAGGGAGGGAGPVGTTGSSLPLNGKMTAPGAWAALWAQVGASSG